MKISTENLEFLLDLIQRKAIPVTYYDKIILLGPEPADNDLRSLGLDRLNALEGYVQTYRTEETGLRHPDRRRKANAVLEKLQQTIAGFRNPKLDPDRAVKVFRMMQKLNNANSGVKKTRFTQKTYVTNKSGMAINTPLPNLKFTSSNGGDVHIMGEWHDVMEMLTRSYGSWLTSEVPDGDGFMPLYVSVNFGYVVAETTDDRTVLLDPLGEVGKAVAQAAAPFMPTLPNTPVGTLRDAAQSAAQQRADRYISQEVQSGVSTARDIHTEADKGKKAIDQLRTPSMDRTKISVTIGLQPTVDDSAHEASDRHRLSGRDLYNMLGKLRAKGLAGS